jgi:hypothetical protein
MRTRTYSELMRFNTFDDRYEYLVLGGVVGRETFAFDRYMNQDFYKSKQWRQLREFVIVRDNGCDLAVPGCDIYHRPVVHHMNPITRNEVLHGEAWILDPEFLITTTHDTHNDIHYGSRRRESLVPVERTPGDTKLW